MILQYVIHKVKAQKVNNWHDIGIGSNLDKMCYNKIMKQHHKVGNRKGRPAYRTPSNFIIRKSVFNVRGKKAK